MESARKKYDQNDPESQILIGHLKGDENITDREMISSKDNQISLFDLPEMYTSF